MTAALLLLALAAARVELVDESFRIPAGEWRYIDDLHLRQFPVLVMADYGVRGAQPGIRLLMMRSDDLARLRTGRPYTPLAATPIGSSGKLRLHVPAAGDYAIVLDNRESAGAAADVHLRIALDFGGGSGPTARYLSPRRQLTVILVSFAFFFAVVTWSARRILRAIRR